MLDEYQRMMREEMKRACFFEDIFQGSDAMGDWICLRKLSFELQWKWVHFFFFFCVFFYSNFYALFILFVFREVSSS